MIVSHDEQPSRNTISFSQILKRISIPGTIFMIVGLGMVFFELQFQWMSRRMGAVGSGLLIFCGISFSIWGVKENIVHALPRLTKRSYHFSLPREGAIYLLIMCLLFVGSLLGQNNPLLMVFAAMAGPFVINGSWIYAMLRRLQLRRVLPDRAMAGENFVATIILENRKFWLSAWLMTVHDRVIHRGKVLTPEILFVHIPRKTAQRGHYDLLLHERGRYEFGPLHVTSRFPLGLVQRGVKLDIREELLVYPRLGRLRPEWRRQLRDSVELISRQRPTQGAFQDEIHQIREYRQGDDPRLIHWKTSARMNELMICDYQESRDRDLLLIVDAWQPEEPTLEQHSEFEKALQFAATLCMEYLQHSRQSSLIVHLLGRQFVSWRGEAGDARPEVLLDAFALLEPSSHPGLDRVMTLTEKESSRQQRTLILSTRAEQIQKKVQNWSNGFGSDIQVQGTSEQELSSVFEEI